MGYLVELFVGVGLKKITHFAIDLGGFEPIKSMFICEGLEMIEKH